MAGNHAALPRSAAGSGALFSIAATVSPIAGGRFLQFNYDWTYEGGGQSGVLLIGFSDEAEFGIV